MPLFDVVCKKCGEKVIDVIVSFSGRYVYNERHGQVGDIKEKSDFKCPKCGGKKYKRLPSSIGGIKIL